MRAVVEIPDAGMVLNLLVRRNSDPTLPARHGGARFATRPGEPGRSIRDVGLLQFKNEEAAAARRSPACRCRCGRTCSSSACRILQNDIERNIDLIVRRNWIDLPVRMASGQRAILSLEKGAAGEQVVNDAFRQWQ